MGAVGGRRRQPGGKGARFVDTFLHDLPVFGLLVRGDLLGVFRFVELPF